MKNANTLFHEVLKGLAGGGRPVSTALAILIVLDDDIEFAESGHQAT
jgi:hypothetical protein